MIHKTITLSLIFMLTTTIRSLCQTDYYRKDSTQTSPVQMQIKLKDGSVLKGIITNQNEKTLRLNTQTMGTLDIDVATVASIIPLSETKNGEEVTYNYTAPNQYYFGQSGFMLNKGEVQLQNIYISHNLVEYGASKNLSLQFGAIIPYIFIWGAKLGVTIDDQVRLFVSSRNYTLLLGSAGGNAGLITVGGTIGTSENNLTLGLNWGYVSNGGGLSNSPSFNIAGTTRVSKRIALVTDNWFINNNDARYSIRLIGGGIKTIGKKSSFGIGVNVFGVNDTYYSNGTYTTRTSNYYPFIYLGGNFKL